MQPRGEILKHTLTSAALGGLLALAVAACSDGSPSLRSPTAPVFDTTPPPSAPSGDYYIGEATVLSSSRTTSCWRGGPGDVRDFVLWLVDIDGASIELNEDMDNWPTDHISFAGTIEGRTFAANAKGGGGCLLEASLTGTFSEDFTSFDALETLVFGPPDYTATVELSWRVELLQ